MKNQHNLEKYQSRTTNIYNCEVSELLISLEVTLSRKKEEGKFFLMEKEGSNSSSEEDNGNKGILIMNEEGLVEHETEIEEIKAFEIDIQYLAE
jgi:hypothetical protein